MHLPRENRLLRGNLHSRQMAFKYLSDALGGPAKPKDVTALLDGLIASGDLAGLQKDTMKVVRMYQARTFDPWDGKTYLGAQPGESKLVRLWPEVRKICVQVQAGRPRETCKGGRGRKDGNRPCSRRERKPSTKPQSPPLGGYKERIGYDIDTTEMSLASRKLFGSIEYERIR